MAIVTARAIAHHRSTSLRKCFLKLDSHRMMKQQKRFLITQAVLHHRQACLSRAVRRIYAHCQSRVYSRHKRACAEEYRKRSAKKCLLHRWKMNVDDLILERRNNRDTDDFFSFCLLRRGFRGFQLLISARKDEDNAVSRTISHIISRTLCRWYDVVQQKEFWREMNRTAADHCSRSKKSICFRHWSRLTRELRDMYEGQEARARGMRIRRARSQLLHWQALTAELRIMGSMQMRAVEHCRSRRTRTALTQWRVFTSKCRIGRGQSKKARKHLERTLMIKYFRLLDAYVYQHLQHKSEKEAHLSHLKDILAKGRLRRSFGIWRHTLSTRVRMRMSEARSSDHHRDVLMRKYFDALGKFVRFRKNEQAISLDVQSSVALNFLRVHFDHWTLILRLRQFQLHKNYTALKSWSTHLSRR
eukprot:844801_1